MSDTDDFNVEYTQQNLVAEIVVDSTSFVTQDVSLNCNLGNDSITVSLPNDSLGCNIVEAGGQATQSLSNSNFLGSDCTGFDGEENRTLTVVNASQIILDTQFLHPNIHYTKTGNVITFLVKVWNDQHITVWKLL